MQLESQQLINFMVIHSHSTKPTHLLHGQNRRVKGEWDAYHTSSFKSLMVALICMFSRDMNIFGLLHW